MKRRTHMRRLQAHPGAAARFALALGCALLLLTPTAGAHSPEVTAMAAGPDAVTQPPEGPRPGCNSCSESCDPTGGEPANLSPLTPEGGAGEAGEGGEGGGCPKPPSSEGSNDGTEGLGGGASSASCPTNPDPGQGSAGDPVRLFTGELRHERRDLVVPGVFSIRILRRYDSQSDYDSPLGYGWSHNYDVRLYKYPDSTIVVRSRCGQRDEYDWNGNSYQIADPERGSAPELTETGGEFELRYPTGVIGFFDADGKLTALEDPRGNRLEMTYEPGGRKALQGISRFSLDSTQASVVAYVYQLKTVEEVLKGDGPTGRTVTFEYDTNGRIDRIVTNSGREVTYSYDEPGPVFRGNLARVERRVVDAAQDPNGDENLVTEYRYTDASYPHNLTSFWDGEDDAAVPVEPIVMTYDTEDRVATQTRGLSVWTFSYDASPPTMTTVTRHVTDGVNPEDALTIFRFDAAGYLIEKTDALQNKIEYVREIDPQRSFLDKIRVHRWNGMELDLQKTIDFGYGTDGNLETRAVTLATGETVTETWGYTDRWVSSYRVESTLKPTIFGTVLTFFRNAADDITNIEEIQRVTQWDTGGPDPVPAAWETTTLAYDANGQLERITPPSDPQIVRTYHDAGDLRVGLLESISLEPGGAADPHLARTFDYDAHGFVDEITVAQIESPPKNLITTLSWDLVGRLTSVTNAAPDPESVVLTYTGPNVSPQDPATAPPGRFLAQIEIGKTSSQAGQIRRLLWDDLGRLAGVERHDGSAFQTFASFTYDSDGNRLTSQDATGRTLTLDYDLLRRLTSITDDASSDPDISNDNDTTFAYDALGNRTRVTDALTRATAFAYDELDRLIQVTLEGPDPDLVTQFEYDAAGNVITVTDPKLQATAYTYDELSRLRSVTQPLLQPPVTYDYDPGGRLARVTNARGNVLDYVYEPWGALKEVQHYPDAATADADDPPVDPDRVVSYTYDLAGNLKTVSEADPFSAGLGLLYTFTYDPLNRVNLATAHYLPGGDRVLDSDYDRFGNRDTLTLTGDGTPQVHSWSYNDLDRLFQAVLPGGATPTLTFDYRANDELETLHFGDGTTDRTAAAYGYYAHGPLKTLTTVDSADDQLQQLAYLVNEVLDITRLDDQHTDTDLVEATIYGYDDISRLTSADYPDAYGLPANDAFVYDDAGNLDDADAQGDPLLTHSYDANNRIGTSPGRGYVPDDDGNLVQITDGAPMPTVLADLSFDFTNRLREYDLAGGKTTTYRYDPFGRRIQKAVTEGPTTTTTWYLWDGDRLLAEYDDASATRQVRYAYAGGFAPVQVAQGAPGAETIYDVHTDHLDTPRMLTNASGSPVWRAAYEAFGEAHLDPANTVTGFNIRFPGQYYDDETKLHYNRFRYYDPSIGRYISADPIGQWAGRNVYVYSFDDPLNWIDPFGLLTWGEALARYSSRRGGTLETPFADHDPGIGPESFPGFEEALESGGSQSFTSELGHDTGDAPGRIVLTLTGTIECYDVCGQTVCFFQGEIGARDDPWDFDKRPWGERDPSGPPYPKEISTHVGAGIPGKPFTTRFTGSRRVTASR